MSLALEAPYAIALLSEYTHTLDALPIDLSRNFADLRELDAVLSSTILTIITKIENLTSMIERGTATKEDKLWLLTEIAEEASRLKLGGEDKIRVACQAADNLKAHSNHLRTLTSHLPGFDTSILDRNTVYPHVSEKSYMPTMTADTGRRRRGAAGQLLNAHSGGAGANGVDPSPVKRKRVRDDDIDAGPTRSPKKPTVAESNTRARQNGRGRKIERGASPSDSILSATPHLPQTISAASGTTGRGANNSTSRTGAATAIASATATTSKRARASNNHTNGRNPTPLAHEAYPAHDTHGPSTTTTTSSSRRGAGVGGGGGGAGGAGGGGPSGGTGPNTNGGGGLYNNVPPATGHPSLPHPYHPNGSGGQTNGVGHGPADAGRDIPGAQHGGHTSQEWNIPSHQMLEGPGMPVARSGSHRSVPASMATASPAVEPDDGGDGDGDGEDSNVYCFCRGVSFGEMIGCDGDNCELEWFHLTCVGLTAPPEGQWYCRVCELKQKNAKKPGRGGKRKAGGGGRGNPRG